MNTDRDQHFTGTFNISGEDISGELIYNEENGVILINVVKQLADARGFGKAYGDLDIITGVLNSGTVVTLFHNHCTKNLTRGFQTQQLVFVAQYAIWSKRDASSEKYNKMTCVLENALDWSGLSALDTSDPSAVSFKAGSNDNVYHWFGARITFSVSLNSELFALPRREESKTTERLVVSIETDEKQDAFSFITIRNKVISFISFAKKENINVVEQYLCDFDDSYQFGNRTEYYKHYLYTSEHRLYIQHNNPWDYNFTLDQLSPEKDIQKELDLLAPIFNLYLSLFKYRDMPLEMIFLNIVQALETFHARFFYDDKKEKYVASVKDRFENNPNYPEIEKLLLSNTQKDDNCRFIILYSRLNDLMIGKYDGMFWEYYGNGAEFAQTVADTRHYYTHYGKSKEKKALAGDNLIDAILVLSILLEYNVCLQLGIDNRDRVKDRLSQFSERQEFQRVFQERYNEKSAPTRDD